MLKNRIALITGISSGIGLATAQKLLAQGARVIGVGEAPPKTDDLGPAFSFLPCDVTREDEIRSVCERVEQQHQALDILVTVCDKLYRGGVLEIDGALIEAASHHIVRAPMLFTKFLNSLLRQSAHASIIHDLPVSALMMEEDVLTASLNTAMVNYVRQSAPQIRPIRVNGVLYGLIKGHLLTPEKEEKYTSPEAAALLPAKRLGTPEDVANVNAFLASDRSSYFSSAMLQVDGGLYTMNPRSMGSAI